MPEEVPGSNVLKNKIGMRGLERASMYGALRAGARILQRRGPENSRTNDTGPMDRLFPEEYACPWGPCFSFSEEGHLPRLRRFRSTRDPTDCVLTGCGSTKDWS